MLICTLLQIAFKHMGQNEFLILVSNDLIWIAIYTQPTLSKTSSTALHPRWICTMLFKNVNILSFSVLWFKLYFSILEILIMSWFRNEIQIQIVPHPIVVLILGRLTIEILFLLPFFKKLIGIITRCVIMCVFVLVFA